ncbi:MAG TPA: TraR/DksA C4-type zinc finger protein [Gemmatimonadaceae bacterium]
MEKINDLPRLTRAQLSELEAELRDELTRLERSMELQGVSSDAAPWTATGSPMAGGATEHLGLATVPPSRAVARHTAVNEALNRMALGTYGICVTCQRPIPYGRLIAMPETAHCVSCGARF